MRLAFFAAAAFAFALGLAFGFAGALAGAGVAIAWSLASAAAIDLADVPGVSGVPRPKPAANVTRPPSSSPAARAIAAILSFSF